MSISRECIVALGILIATATPSHGAWRYESKSDPLSDQRVSTAKSTTKLGSISQSVVVRCDGDTLDTFVEFGMYLDDDPVIVRFRIDKNSLVEEMWAPSADGTAVFANDEKALAWSLVRGGSFVVEAVDFRGQPHRATFGLTGASKAIRSVLDQCGVLELPISSTVGLRSEISAQLEGWGPRNIVLYKKVLTAVGRYRGRIDPKLEPEFALAVQGYYDDYITECKEGVAEDQMCKKYLPGWGADGSGRVPSISDVIYERSPDSLRQEVGSLPVGE